MADFRTSFFSSNEISVDDTGVDVKSVVELIKENQFYEQLCSLMNVDEIINEKINIPGAALLVSKIKEKNDEFEKFDLPSDFQDLDFSNDDDGNFVITFNNFREHEHYDKIKKDSFKCYLKYSSKSDFFDGLFSMSKYANTLTKSGNSNLVFKNLELIKELYSNPKSRPKKKVYRILKDKDGNFFLRAIVSKMYNNYDNNFTVFVGLLTLHNDIKVNKSKFSLGNCEYNESYIKAFFRKEGDNTIEKVGKAKSIIELSNDEIKREPLKFSLMTSLIFGDNKNGTNEIYIKPRNVKYVISSVRHNLLPEKTILELSNFSDYIEMESDIYEDIRKISKIQSPDQIRHLVYSKISKTKQSELKSKNFKVLSILGKRIDSIYELLDLLNKVYLIAEDIEAREYLRYLIYDILTGKKSPDEKYDKDDIE